MIRLVSDTLITIKATNKTFSEGLFIIELDDTMITKYNRLHVITSLITLITSAMITARLQLPKAMITRLH